MKLFLKNTGLILFIFLCQASVSGQSKYYTAEYSDTLHVNYNNVYKISQLSIIPFSETISIGNKLLSTNQYRIKYSDGEFSLTDSSQYSAFDTIIVSYRAFRIALKKEYRKRSLVYKFDPETRDTIQVINRSSESFDAESIFGSGIERSGTLVRGFTIGTNKDFSLNSGFRLQLSGRLSDDIEIVAALTDENTPIQPEGNTEKLDELDQVFIQIKHPRATGTFGDYQLEKRYGEFGVINRKLQGLLGEYNYENSNAYFSVASSRGKFNTNKFTGQDGVQGPYRLAGINNEPDIIVIAGTEKVYVDGIEMKRGERNDYVIEYSNAEIIFTPNKLITSASRISVDFEYSDRRFARNFIGAGASTKLFNEKFGLKFQYMREGDNENAPIDISLSDSDKKILENAGDDRNAATKSGVSLALPDSLGNAQGVYEKIDTVINNNAYSYYKYNPGDKNSIYNVSFSFVGQGNGDYIRESLGNYRWVGINKGGYSPVIFLPLPESKQFGNLVLDYNPVQGISISLELAGSLRDKNLFSTKSDNDNYGGAANLFIKIDPQKITLGGNDFGEGGFSYKDRFVQGRFTALDRFNQVEFNRYYNITDNNEQVDEHLRELNLVYLPIKIININSSFGFLSRGNEFKSDRYNNSVTLSDNKNYSFQYNLDYVKTKDSIFRSNWFRQNGNGYYSIGKFKPGIDFLAENKEDKFLANDSLNSNSLKYYEVSPFVSVTGLSGFKATLKYSLRNDYFPLNGIMVKESRSVAKGLELNYDGSRSVNTSLNIVVRDKNYTEEYKKLGNLDNQTILIRSRSNLRLWDPVLNGNIFYEVSTQKSAKLQRVFVLVQKGTGNYKYLGDLNNNGVGDENEYELTLFDGDYILITIPTEELFPVINLKTSTNWRVNYSEIFDKNSFIGKLLKPITTETFWRVEENSTEQDFKKIYLLHFSSFQNEQTTIAGSNFIQQDLSLFENIPDFSLRFRFSQTKSFNQFNDGPVRGFSRERSIRLRTILLPEISNQTDFVSKNDNLTINQLSTSNRQRLITNNSIKTDFSYRPEANIEVGFTIKVGRSTDDFPNVPTIIDANTETLRMNLSFAGAGRIRIEIERNELNGTANGNYLPFELTDGNVIGKNYFWRFNFDYRLATNLQSTVNYDGRWQGSGRVIHTMRAEFRAYF